MDLDPALRVGLEWELKICPVKTSKSPHSCRQSPHSCRQFPHSSRQSPHSCRQSPHSSRQSPHSCRQSPDSCSQSTHSCRQSPDSCRQSPHSSPNLPTPAAAESVTVCRFSGGGGGEGRGEGRETDAAVPSHNGPIINGPQSRHITATVNHTEALLWPVVTGCGFNCTPLTAEGGSVTGTSTVSVFMFSCC